MTITNNNNENCLKTLNETNKILKKTSSLIENKIKAISENPAKHTVKIFL